MLNPFWFPKGFDPKEDYKRESNSKLEHVDKVIEEQIANLDRTEDEYKETPCGSVGINSAYEITHKLELLIKLDNTNACRDNDGLRSKVVSKILELIEKL